MLGAGNYSSAVEMVSALFLENCAVVHKPHPLNKATDLIWEKVFEPLVEYQALSFCDPDSGTSLTTDKRVSKIYFTGGASTAKKIAENTDIPIVSECGGNNPFFIVPPDRDWTADEIHHQSMVIATMIKFNGGAVCGRPQTFVTSKHWKQRREFLDALKNALVNETPATPSYYPNSTKVFEEFKNAYPDAEVLQCVEDKDNRKSDILFIEDIAQDSYAVTHEAFTLVVDEVALDVPATIKEYLPIAVKFANKKLLGTLTCCIIIDDDTLKNNKALVDASITFLQYGAIGVNTMPPFMFLNPYLTWGGNEEGKDIVSGHGNFGNLLNYQNVEKSISFSDFTSAGHMKSVNTDAWFKLSKNYAEYTANPKFVNLVPMAMSLMKNNIKKKNF
ncbi:MAG: hypothetical protein BEN19_07075 [Epulopiscium sp. Nuni2H_MBin003]|nr:MAG: hypothetical protein BEN19_07075 [Epulopiscium sp. Nuni2H_MBin003]